MWTSFFFFFLFIIVAVLGFVDNLLVKILSLRALNHQSLSEVLSLLDIGAKLGSGLVKKDPVTPVLCPRCARWAHAKWQWAA